MTDGRMFSKEVTDSDAFIMLSSTAQALYLHINLTCDNWGVTAQTAVAIMKAHATETDLKELVEKRFLLHIGDIYLVKHWFLMNTLRIERLKKSVYHEDFESIIYIKPNLSYTENYSEGCQRIEDYCQRFAKSFQTLPKIAKDCQQNVEAFPELEVEVEEEYRNRNIEIGNIEEEIEKKATPTPPTQQEIIDYVKEKGYTINPTLFYEYYASNGWKDSNGKPVKNWKLKLVNWQKHEKPQKKVYTLDEMEVKEIDINELRERMFRKGY